MDSFVQDCKDTELLKLDNTQGFREWQENITESWGGGGIEKELGDVKKINKEGYKWVFFAYVVINVDNKSVNWGGGIKIITFAKRLPSYDEISILFISYIC